MWNKIHLTLRYVSFISSAGEKVRNDQEGGSDFWVGTNYERFFNGLIGDIYEDHVVSCDGIIGIKHRRNVVRDTFVDICCRSGISAGKEVDIGLDGERDKSLRPVDMLLYLWDGGLDVCVDLTGSSPLTQTGMVDFVPGRAVIDVAQRKTAHAVTLLKRIQKFSIAQDIRALCKTRTFALGDKPHSFFAPEGKTPRRGLNPRPLACGNNLPKVTFDGHLS
uniref:ABC transporter A family member 9-like n=1 Tax=Tanacetum cinerariifolium TaxID=118510 RepID=A0A6L2NYN7_TANCI|nr:ABC transporter A family member 9-like [Tanacetum cinerariifolium]